MGSEACPGEGALVQMFAVSSVLNSTARSSGASISSVNSACIR